MQTQIVREMQVLRQRLAHQLQQEEAKVEENRRFLARVDKFLGKTSHARGPRREVSKLRNRNGLGPQDAILKIVGGKGDQWLSVADITKECQRLPIRTRSTDLTSTLAATCYRMADEKLIRRRKKGRSVLFGRVEKKKQTPA